MPLIWAVQGVLGSSFEDTLRQKLGQHSEMPSKLPRAASPEARAAASYESTRQAKRKRGPALVVSDIMTRNVRTISPEETLAEALRILKRHRFRHLPVVNAQGLMVGMLSDRDLLSAVGQGEYDPVSTRMTGKVLVATPDTPLRMASGVMLTERIHSLPVVNQGTHLIGILTTSDILKALWQHAPIELWV